MTPETLLADITQFAKLEIDNRALELNLITAGESERRRINSKRAEARTKLLEDIQHLLNKVNNDN